MPLNATREERLKQGAEDLAKKLKLEVRFKRELRELFATIDRDLEAAIRQTGKPPEAQQYYEDFIGLLTRAHRKTNEAFSGSIVAFLRKNKDNPEELIVIALKEVAAARGMTYEQLLNEMDAYSRLEARNFIHTHVKESASAITATNQKQMDILWAAAIATLSIDLGRQPTLEEISKYTRKKFKAKAKGRIEHIAATEIQRAAEASKSIDREIFTRTANNLLLSSGNAINAVKMEETWVTMGDSIVRDSHIEADGITKNEDGVFIVQGQSLLYPGDTSLGATIDNVAGCRCSAVMVIDYDN